jgi:hypothetical protein
MRVDVARRSAGNRGEEPCSGRGEARRGEARRKAATWENELYVDPDGEGVGWWFWSTMALAGAAVASIVALLGRRRAG